MKKPYQIEAQRAVNRLEEMAAEENRRANGLPMAEINPIVSKYFDFFQLFALAFLS
jgi:hypothetical protein